MRDPGNVYVSLSFIGKHLRHDSFFKKIDNLALVSNFACATSAN